MNVWGVKRVAYMIFLFRGPDARRTWAVSVRRECVRWERFGHGQGSIKTIERLGKDGTRDQRGASVVVWWGGERRGFGRPASQPVPAASKHTTKGTYTQRRESATKSKFRKSRKARACDCAVRPNNSRKIEIYRNRSIRFHQ